MAAASLPSSHIKPRKRAFASGEGRDARTDEEGEHPVARVVKREKALHPERLATMQQSFFKSYGKQFMVDKIPTLIMLSRLKRCACGPDGLVRFTNAPLCSPAYMRAAVLPIGEFAVYKAGTKVIVEGYPRTEVHTEESDFDSCEAVLKGVMMMYAGYILLTWELLVDSTKYEVDAGSRGAGGAVKHLTLATVENYCHSYRAQISNLDFSALVVMQGGGTGRQGGKIPTMDVALRQITRSVDANLRTFKLEPLIMSSPSVAAPAVPTRVPTPAPPPYVAATGKGDKLNQDEVMHLLKDARKKVEGLQREKTQAARAKGAGNPLGFKGAGAAGRAERIVYKRMARPRKIR